MAPRKLKKGNLLIKPVPHRKTQLHCCPTPLNGIVRLKIPSWVCDHDLMVVIQHSGASILLKYCLSQYTYRRASSRGSHTPLMQIEGAFINVIHGVRASHNLAWKHVRMWHTMVWGSFDLWRLTVPRANIVCGHDPVWGVPVPREKTGSHLGSQYGNRWGSLLPKGYGCIIHRSPR